MKTRYFIYNLIDGNVHVTINIVFQVGDGTTTVVLLAAEFLKEAKPFIEDGVHSQNLIRSYRTASHLVCDVKFCFCYVYGLNVDPNSPDWGLVGN